MPGKAPPNRQRQLRAFCFAAQAGSISKAGERLCLSQPSVSLLIKALESDLGVTLFERRGPRIELTGAGKILLEASLPLIEGLEHLPELFAQRLGEAQSGALDIAAGESTILYLLADHVKAYTERYPRVNTHLHNVTGRDGMQLLRNGDVDFAVGSMIEVPADVSFVPIFTYDPVLITPVNHPLAKKRAVSLGEISHCGLILPPRHLSTWRVVDLVFQQHGLSYNVCLEAGGWEVVKKFVELGLGVSIVTSICVTGRERLAVVPLTRYFPRRTYGVVMRKGKFLSPQARAFLEVMDPEFFHRGPHRPTARAPGPEKTPRPPSRDFTGHDESLP